MSNFTSRIRPHVRRELEAARQAETSGHVAAAQHHLERAHVLGQASTIEHLRVHFAMGRMALRHRDCAAAWGQAWRSLAAVIFTPVGLLPIGNTGGSNVSAFHRMPIAADLQQLIDDARG